MDRDELFFGRVDDEELAVIEMEDEDGIVREYAVLAIFSAPPFSSEYMAAMELADFAKDEEDQTIVFMRYLEEDDESFTVEGISNEIELDCVSDFYFNQKR